MATLSLKNINKIYPNKVQAVFDFNLDIKDKEFIVFVGPSGCGKSTTLRMVAGLEDITSGSLYIDGRYVNDVEPKDRDIAMVFQNYALYPHMTVYNNMAFSLKMRKVLCPVIPLIPEIEDLKNQNKELLKGIRKLNKKCKKQNEASDILKEIDKQYALVLENDAKIKKLQDQNQIIGRYELRIKEIEKLIANVQKKIAQLKDYIEKTDDEKEKKMYSQDLAEREKSIDALNKILNELNNSDVPLFEYRKLSKQEINIKVYQAAKILDLTRYLYRKPGALSGGQRQRVALGRAIVRKPKVFLMDEPLSNLDAKLRVQTRSEITKIHKTVGATTIYVTHDQTEAMTMADRIVVMKDGYIQQIGEPDEIYQNPANMFVAGFIGNPAMNFLNVHFNGKNLIVDGTNTQFKLSKEQVKTLGNELGKEGDLVLGIRPECILLEGSEQIEKESTKVEITVDFRELLGYEAVLYSKIGEQKLLTKIPNKIKTKEDEKIQIFVNTKELFFFSKENGIRIR